MDPTFDKAVIAAVSNRVHKVPTVDVALAQVGGLSQPVHTLYGGAQLFKNGSLAKLGDLARGHFTSWVDSDRALVSILDLEEDRETPWSTVYESVVGRLRHKPIEDFRIDFEDGYGARSSEEEDLDAIRTAACLAHEMEADFLPPSFGIRVKAFLPETVQRSIRTLDLFMTQFLEATSGVLPSGFVVTLPKVTHKIQVGAISDLLELIEGRFSLARRSIRIELMVEGPEALVTEHGTNPLKGIVGEAQGRCRGVHFGTYDYSAALDVSAEYQSMDHPACIYALLLMKASLHGSRVWLADGATNILPLPVHREIGTRPLTVGQKIENEAQVKRAWQQSFRAVHNSLKLGLYQGWDLHPYQIGIRLVAHYAFFLRYLPSAMQRLSSFLAKAAQATAIGGTFDDAATGQGLLNFFIRALELGVIGTDHLKQVGITSEELMSRSFIGIVEGRRNMK